MARNFSFLKSKKFWILLMAGIAVLFFAIFSRTTKEELAFLENRDSDSIPPVSQIAKPQESTVMGRYFFVTVRDVDAGGSGLVKDQCLYSVYDCGSLPCVQTVSNAQRTCNESFLISVGEGKECFSQGKDECRIVVKSQDLAGNKNMQSEAQGSIRTFGVDLIPPKVIMEQPFFERTNLKISFEASVADNVEVSNCDVAIGRESQYGLVPLRFLEFSCTTEGKKACYQVSGSHVFSAPGMYEFSLACWDLAGNTGRSEIYNIEAIQNRSPQISSCRVMPALGTPATKFLFQGEALDPDGDVLTYEWEFGDGTTALRKEVSHQYKVAGTYTPQVRVTDSYGAEEHCSTAWAVVEVGEVEE